MAEEDERVGYHLPQPIVQVSEPPRFDLEAYISNYDGFTRLDRLTTVGITSLPLRYDALKRAQSEARQVRNIPRYLAISNHLISLYPTDPTIRPDNDYVRETTALIQSETHRLDQELKGYKNNLIKESIRMATEELGVHHFAAGNLPEAAKSFAKMRDYGTTQAHLAFMHLRMALVSVAQGNWLNVQNALVRIRSQPSFADYGKIVPAIEPLLGLTALAAGDYSTAAGHFICADPAFASPMEAVAGGIVLNRAVLSANDCATYGALTALAALDRAELQSQVLDSGARFRQFLELEPHLRRALTAFVASKYTQCLRILEQHHGDWLCDVYLQRHIDGLFTLIRRKCIVEYFRPFSVVTIDAMAEAFGSGSSKADVEAMTDELVSMISGGLLNARIDAVTRQLAKPQTGSERVAVAQRALRVAEEQEKDMCLRLWRMELLSCDMEVQVEAKKGRMDMGAFLDGTADGEVPLLGKRGKKG